MVRTGFYDGAASCSTIHLADIEGQAVLARWAFVRRQYTIARRSMSEPQRRKFKELDGEALAAGAARIDLNDDGGIHRIRIVLG